MLPDNLISTSESIQAMTEQIEFLIAWCLRYLPDFKPTLDKKLNTLPL